jgi:hypothetical protein
MQQLADAIARIRAMTHAPTDTRLSGEIDVEHETRGLRTHLDIFKARELADSGRKPQGLDVAALLQRWKATRPSLEDFTKREIRALCWEADATADLAFVSAIMQNDALRTNIRILRGLWFAHEYRWRLPSADGIEQLLRAALAVSDRIHPKWLRNAATCDGLLSADAPSALTAAMSRDWSQSRKLLGDFGLTADGALARAALEAATRTWADRVVSQRESATVADLLAAGVKGLLKGADIDGPLFTSVVERIVGGVPRASEHYRNAVKVWILDEPRLGHPARVRTRGNWAGISAPVRKFAVQLFAARDLVTFFEVLIGSNQDYQERRPFWERYVNSPQLVNFAIASDFHDRRKLIAAIGPERADVAKLDGAPDDHSCFVIHFSGRRDIVIAEMSQPNKAMYLFSVDTFAKSVGSLEDGRFEFKELRSQQSMLDRWVHRGDWHETFRRNLASLGVFPGE